MKKETFAQKARKMLSEMILSEKKEKEAFEGNIGVGMSKINKRRKKLEESLKY